MNLKYILSYIIVLLVFLPLNGAEEMNQTTLERAKKIHEKILTVDTHTDTSLMLRSPSFDIGKKNDPRKRGSYPALHSQ